MSGWHVGYIGMGSGTSVAVDHIAAAGGAGGAAGGADVGGSVGHHVLLGHATTDVLSPNGYLTVLRVSQTGASVSLPLSEWVPFATLLWNPGTPTLHPNEVAVAFMQQDAGLGYDDQSFQAVDATIPRSGAVNTVSPTFDHSFKPCAFHNSNYGITSRIDFNFFTGETSAENCLYSVDPTTLAVTRYDITAVNPDSDTEANGGDIIGGGDMCGLNDTTIIQGLGGSGSPPTAKFRTIVRSGTSFSFGASTVYSAGTGFGQIYRIDDTHFAIWSVGGAAPFGTNVPSGTGTKIVIGSVSGSTVSFSSGSVIADGSPAITGVLDSTHLLANADNTFYVYTFTTGGGVSSVAGPFVNTNLPSPYHDTVAPIASMADSPDFLLFHTGYDGTTARYWVQGAHWNGSAIEFGDPLEIPNTVAV